MRRLLALSAVAVLGVLVLLPAPARAQGNGPCIHQGGQVQCPPGLPPGSQSVAFVPGGTNWRNSATGAIVFVPSTTFPPFMAGPTPAAPPGPTTQPGPGTQPSGPPPGVPLTARDILGLTLQSIPANAGLCGVDIRLYRPVECTPQFAGEEYFIRDDGPPDNAYDHRRGFVANQYRRIGEVIEDVTTEGAAVYFRSAAEAAQPTEEVRLVEQSDIENAPAFAPPASPAELDQVM